MTDKTGADLPFVVADSPPPDAVIKVVGVGGCGCNSVGHMFDQGASGIQTYCVNTDVQALEQVSEKCTQTLQIGELVTDGLGTGADAEKGLGAALEDKSRIAGMLEGADLTFIVAGMGGGTGTGASPLIAAIAQNLGILTIAVVTEPFRFENRDEVARDGIEKLRPAVDSIITLSNNKLMERHKGQRTSVRDCFANSNNVLFEAVGGISDLITQPGMINVDYADLRTIMKSSGRAIIGLGVGSGVHRAREATEYAVDNPLNDDVVSKDVQRLLVNIAASDRAPLTLGDYQMVNQVLDEKLASHEAKKVIGTTVDSKLGDDIKVTVIATAFATNQQMPEQMAQLAEENGAPAAMPEPRQRLPGGAQAATQQQPEKIFEFTDWDGGNGR